MELLLAMTIMIAASIALAVFVSSQLKTASMRTTQIIATVAVTLLVLHALWLNGHPALITWVGSPDAIVWANGSPLFVALLIAAAWRSIAIRWQRYAVAIALSGICLMQAYGPIFGSPPPMRPSRITQGVHRQSTLSTCSAAAAATLLGDRGIATTETEMAGLCLTRSRGTLQVGLYRGLRLKMPDAKVQFLNGNFDRVLNAQGPVLVGIGLGDDAAFGWQRVGHSVVVFGRTGDGNLDIGDPMSGRYTMTPHELRQRWTGQALQVIP